MQRTAHILALVGPTAVGKTDVSIELAARVNAEIVNCDSMQVYRGMPILTQQPSAAQRAAVAHHVFEYVDPADEFNVGRYRQEALRAMDSVRRRGKTVLLVGGTGLYLRALTDGLCDAPRADETVRAALWDAVQAQGSAELHTRLQRIDPLAAAKIHPHNSRRVVRALEVFEVTGRPLSSFWREQGPGVAMSMVALTWPRAELYDRINQRVQRMLDHEGVLDEARQVMGWPLSRTARQVHGLPFLAAHVRGELSREQAVAAWQQQVRQYAKRQLIWFRAAPRLRWIELTASDTIATAAERALQALEAADVESR